jgi:Prp8 binding protein
VLKDAASGMDTITGLSLNLEGTHLLSNSMDSRLRAWDVRPFADASRSRCERVFDGVHHGAEKVLLRCAWSPNYSSRGSSGGGGAQVGEVSLPPVMVSGGSADRMVHIWDGTSSRLMYTLPGHKGSVNEVRTTLSWFRNIISYVLL